MQRMTDYLLRFFKYDIAIMYIFVDDPWLFRRLSVCCLQPTVLQRVTNNFHYISTRLVFIQPQSCPAAMPTVQFRFLTFVDAAYQIFAPLVPLCDPHNCRFTSRTPRFADSSKFHVHLPCRTARSQSHLLFCFCFLFLDIARSRILQEGARRIPGATLYQGEGEGVSFYAFCT